MEGRGVSVWEDVRGGILPGTEELVGQMGLLLRETELDPEIRGRERFADRRALVDIFSGVDSDRYIRNVRIHDASVKHGYTLTEISKYLRLHPSTLSRIVKRVVEGLDAQGKVSPSL